MQEHAHPRRARQFFAIRLAEANRWAELRDGIAHVAGRERQAAHVVAPDLALPVSGIEILRAELQQLMRARVVRRQFVEAERPAAVRDPVALLEVPRIERAAPAAPAIAAAAEIAAARAVRERIGKSGVLAAIEIAGFVVRPEATAFEHAGVDPRPRHFERKRNAGDTSADDADRRFNDCVVFNSTSIDEHPLLPIFFTHLLSASIRLLDPTGAGKQTTHMSLPDTASASPRASISSVDRRNPTASAGIPA